jgi:hypothetical protein
MPFHNTPPNGTVKFEPQEVGYPPHDEAVNSESVLALGTDYEITGGFLDPKYAVEGRIARLKLQREAAKILTRERVGKCLRGVVPGERFVEVRRGEKGTFLNNLMTCGSIWVCPVCASKVSQERCLEVRGAIRKQEERGGEVLLVTHTMPHTSQDALEYLLVCYGQVRKYQREQRGFKRLMEAFHVEGTIRNLEVTYGANGWHVHDHELFFIGPGYRVFRIKLQEELLKFWQGTCERLGLPVPSKRGIQVDGGEKTARYMNKWGLDAELTKSHIKKGREGSMTPWDFLRECRRDLFKVYAEAFKGKKQLHWSRGLRELLGMRKPKTDAEIAAEIDPVTLLLATLERQEWFMILREEKREEFYRMIQDASEEGIREYIEKLQAEVNSRDCPF